jgi:hypothetical protein
MTNTVRALIGAMSLLALAACTSDGSLSQAPSSPAQDGRPIPITTSGWRPGDPSRTGLITGQLHADENGCPYLGQKEQRQWIVWPAGYSARIAAGGAVELIGPDGAVLAREGDYVEAGGAPADLTSTVSTPCVPKGVVLTTIESSLNVTPAEVQQ